MNTDELVMLLAKDAGPVEQNAVVRRFMMALGWGAFGTTLAMALTLGVRDDIVEAMRVPMFWVKLVFPLAVAVTAYLAVTRLARPGMRLGHLPGALAALLAAIWLLAIVTMINAVPEARHALVFGETWRACLRNIPLLSLPVWVGATWAMKGLAPTRPALAGGAAGLLAGAISVTVYALHCPEMGAPFVAIWYVIGMLTPAFAGALIGSRLLRW